MFLQRFVGTVLVPCQRLFNVIKSGKIRVRSPVKLALRTFLWKTATARTMQSQAHYPKHYCGVFGIFGHPNAAELAYYGLYALQHRGQESAGIVTCHEGKFYKHHGMGLVPQIFNGEILHGLVGKTAVGHTRYSTTGSSQLKN